MLCRVSVYVVSVSCCCHVVNLCKPPSVVVNPGAPLASLLPHHGGAGRQTPVSLCFVTTGVNCVDALVAVAAAAAAVYRYAIHGVWGRRVEADEMEVGMAG